MSNDNINGSAILEIPMESNKVATILYQALLPETESIPSDRANSTVSIENEMLVVKIEANDLTALRASLNSFSAWIAACIATLESIEKS